MAVNTILFDFSVEASTIGDDSLRSDVVKLFRAELENIFPQLKFVYDMLTEDGYLCILSEDNLVLITIRFYNQGLITMNIEFYKEEEKDSKLTFDNIKALENVLRKKLNSNRSKYLPPIKRGGKIDVYLTSTDEKKTEKSELSCKRLENTLAKKIKSLSGNVLPAIKRGDLARYFPSSDERIIEYDIDKVLFDERSEFQKIQIVHSKTLGNMLILDELQNIADVDLIYTETLMQRGIENYEGKEICILGGGDGALLYELLKEKPKYVVMLEIDETVMQACNKYMSSICGDVLEKRKGDNYEIIVGDCMDYMKRYIIQGKKFDYVFGDLTDIPISDTPTGEIWNFIRSILENTFKILKLDGKYLTHGNGSSCIDSLKMYEQQLELLQPPVKFTKATAFVPSFMEEWVFYQVQFA